MDRARVKNNIKRIDRNSFDIENAVACLSAYELSLYKLYRKMNDSVLVNGKTRGDVYRSYVVADIGVAYYKITGKKYSVHSPDSSSELNPDFKKEDYPFLSLVHIVISQAKGRTPSFSRGILSQYKNVANKMKQGDPSDLDELIRVFCVE